jgi:hypothetical protein
VRIIEKRKKLSIPTASLLHDLKRALEAGELPEADWLHRAVANAFANPRPGFTRVHAAVPLDPASAPRVAILEELLNLSERELPCAARFVWSLSVDVRRSEVTVARRVRPERRRTAVLALLTEALLSAFPDRGQALANTLTDRLDTAGWFIESRRALHGVRSPADALPYAVIELANRLEPDRMPAEWTLETHSRHSKLIWEVVASWPRAR